MWANPKFPTAPNAAAGPLRTLERSDAGCDRLEKVIQLATEESDCDDDDNCDEADHQAVLNGGGATLVADLGELVLELHEVTEHCVPLPGFGVVIGVDPPRLPKAWLLATSPHIAYSDPSRHQRTDLSSAERTIGRQVGTKRWFGADTWWVPQNTADVEVTPAVRSVARIAGVRRLAEGRKTALTASLVTVGTATLLGVRAISDPSPWLHLRIGQFLLDGGRFGLPDPWAPFAAKPFVLTEWLPAIVGYLTYHQFGAPGIAWLRCAGILAFLTAMVWTNRQVTGGAIAVVVALAALLGAYDGLTERPQMLSLVFLAITLGAWWRTTSDLHARWWLVPLTWLWAMSHGLWPIGIGLGILMALGLLLDRRVNFRQSLQLLLVPLASVVAAGLTPIGPKLLIAPFTVGSNARSFVGEWQSPTIGQPVTLITLTLIGLVMLAWIRSSRKPQWWQLGLLAASLVSCLFMARTVAVAAVLVSPLVAQEVQRHIGSKRSSLTRRARVAWLALVVAASVAAMPLAAAVAQNPVGVPERLSNQLNDLPKGTIVVATGDITGWLLWTAPDLRPVEDLRVEIFSRERVQEFVETMQAGPRWREFIDQSHVTAALLLSDSPLAIALQERTGWRAAGSDAGYVLLRKP